MVARTLLGGLYAVAAWFPGSSGWLLGAFYAAAALFLERFKVVARVVFRVFLGGFYAVAA